MENVAAHIIVRGRVQGVYYRATAQETALQLGLVGWARNLPDGTVEIRAEGAKQQIEKLLAWCRKGPPAAAVESVDAVWEAAQGLSGFAVRR